MPIVERSLQESPRPPLNLEALFNTMDQKKKRVRDARDARDNTTGNVETERGDNGHDGHQEPDDNTPTGSFAAVDDIDSEKIEVCIRALRDAKQALKTENMLLSDDIRKIRALAEEKSERAILAAAIEERFKRLTSQNLPITMKASTLERTARSSAKARKRKLHADELKIRQYQPMHDEKGSLVATTGDKQDPAIQRLLDDYQEQENNTQAFKAAYNRLRQTLAEHRDFSDFVRKVKNIAIAYSGSQMVNGSHDHDLAFENENSQDKTPPSSRRERLDRRRASLFQKYGNHS